MGLDMYLYKKHFISQGEWVQPELKRSVTVKKGGKVDKSVNTKKVIWVVEEVGYWRKANQIHNWFVENVQRGQDDCKEYFVHAEDLTELLELCKEVKADNSKAEELLPTKSGFFFGDTEYNEWYFRDIDNTIKILEAALKDEESCDYSYTSSW